MVATSAAHGQCLFIGLAFGFMAANLPTTMPPPRLLLYAWHAINSLIALTMLSFTLVGDVNPKEVVEKAGAFTPVPGGVGLLTVAMLMKNTLKAARLRRQ